MKTVRTFTLLAVILLFTSCKKKTNKVKSNSNTEIKSVKKSSNSIEKLILKENSFGNLKLKKGMVLTEKKLIETFPNYSISKNVGEQDGPNYYYYKIGTKAILKTPNTENKVLSQLYINEKSSITDEYGIKIGMTYNDVKEKRANMIVSTEHFHIYLSKKDSNIIYEMLLEDYNGPDKEEYTLDDVKNSKVVSIIWK